MVDYWSMDYIKGSIGFLKAQVCFKSNLLSVFGKGADLFNVNQYNSIRKLKKFGWLNSRLLMTQRLWFIRMSRRLLPCLISQPKILDWKLTIKNMVVYQFAPGSHDESNPILLENQELTHVSKFKCLHSTISNNNKLDHEFKI